MGFLKKKDKEPQVPQSQASTPSAVPSPPPRTYSAVPEDWPHVDIHPVLEPIQGPLQELKVGVEIGKAGVLDRAEKSALGVQIKHALGGEINAAMVVWQKSGPPIPLLLNLQPWDQYKVDPGSLAVLIRSNQEYRWSPVAMYSVCPIPAELEYILRGSTEALFESQTSLMRIQKVPLEELHPRVVSLFKEFFEVELDYSPDSLHAVDDVLKRLHWREDTPVRMSTCVAIGAYVGEVFIRNLGGEWIMVKEQSEYPLVKLGTVGGGDLKTLYANPMGKVQKQIQHCDRDEVHHLYESTRRGLRIAAESDNRSEDKDGTRAQPLRDGTAIEKYSIKPDGWPDIPLQVGSENEALIEISNSLMLACLGNQKAGTKFAGEVADVEVPILVYEQGKPSIPVFPFLFEVAEQDEAARESMAKHVVAIRSCREFRTSPIVLYSNHPLSDEVRFMYGTTPPALFLCQATVLVFKGVPFGELPGHVVSLIEEFYGEKLDGTPGTLDVIDKVLMSFHWREDPPMFHPVIDALTAYVGDVFNHHAGTVWFDESIKLDRPMILKGRNAFDLPGMLAGQIKEAKPDRKLVDLFKNVQAMPMEHLKTEEGASTG